MGFFNTVLDVFVYLLMKIKDLFFLLIEAGSNLFSRGIEEFLELGIFEKLIVFTVIPAFFAVILSVAKYNIFETYYYINNPLAVYMIGIVFLMMGSLFFRSGLYVLLVRIIPNIMYMGWIIYLPMAGKLTKAEPHIIVPGYYVNIAVPALFIAFSCLSLIFRSKR